MLPGNTRPWRARILIALMAVALILLYLRDRITFPPPLLYGGLALAGLLVVAMGIDDVRKRRASFSDSEYNYYATYYGFSAIMWGSFFVLLGLSMVVAGAILLLGMAHAASTFLKARPSAALVLAGAVMVFYGIPTILGSVEERSSFWRLLGSAPGRLLGIVLVLTGLLIILLGGWEIVAPHAFDKLVGQAASSFPVLPE